MKHLVQFPLESGGFIWVEVNEASQDEDPRRISRPEDLVKKAQQTFEDALEGLKPVANGIMKKLTELNQPADEVEVKFGLKMNAEAGAIIASAGIEGNYEITLKWKRTP
jgi:hypothetical protein